MTAEVCLINRLAVVLAADSATTVTEWTGQGQEERYFKGANKIFQLSDHHPVGLMIYNSADIMKVPWELVAKAFRNKLQKKSFNTLPEYAGEFFDFLEGDTQLFPSTMQKRAFSRNPLEVRRSKRPYWSATAQMAQLRWRPTMPRLRSALLSLKPRILHPA